MRFGDVYCRGTSVAEKQEVPDGSGMLPGWFRMLKSSM